jgi:hypothetical protein
MKTMLKKYLTIDNTRKIMVTIVGDLLILSLGIVAAYYIRILLL